MADIQCGESVDGVSGDEMVSFRFTNDQEQDIRFSVSNNTSIPILKIMDSEGRYVERVYAMECDEDECDGVVFTIKELSPGEYTVEIMANGKGGEFEVDVTCSVESMGAKGTVVFS